MQRFFRCRCYLWFRRGCFCRCQFTRNVRNCLICPDLFRKLMFSNPSPPTGWRDVGESSQIKMSRSVQEAHISPNPYPHGCGVGANLQK